MSKTDNVVHPEQKFETQTQERFPPHDLFLFFIFPKARARVRGRQGEVDLLADFGPQMVRGRGNTPPAHYIAATRFPVDPASHPRGVSYTYFGTFANCKLLSLLKCASPGLFRAKITNRWDTNNQVPLAFFLTNDFVTYIQFSGEHGWS